MVVGYFSARAPAKKLFFPQRAYLAHCHGKTQKLTQEKLTEMLTGYNIFKKDKEREKIVILGEQRDRRGFY